MPKNYTPLTLEKPPKPKQRKTNMVLIIIAILTACVMAVILLLLIQQKSTPTQTVPVQDDQQIPSPQPEQLDETTPSSDSSGLETPPVSTGSGEEISPTDIPLVSPTP